MDVEMKTDAKIEAENTAGNQNHKNTTSKAETRHGNGIRTRTLFYDSEPRGFSCLDEDVCDHNVATSIEIREGTVRMTHLNLTQ